MPSAKNPPNESGDQRIAKLLARAGVASRREVERMIAEGRIALNGVAIVTPATLLTSLDGVTVDGNPVAAPAAARLFIYHTDAAVGSQQSETFKMMEDRLLKVIMNPAMMISWGLGLYLAWSVYGFQGGWLHAKLLFVLALTGVHMMFSRAVRRFARDENTHSARYWRLMNEAPTVLMIAIVIMAVVKPF